MRQSTTVFFSSIKNTMRLHGQCGFERHTGFPDPVVNGHPVDLEQSRFALEQAAKKCLGEDHRMHLHSFGEGPSVAAQLLTIAAECKAALNGYPISQSELGVDVYGVFVTAFNYYNDERSMERTLRNHHTPVILVNRAQAA